MLKKFAICLALVGSPQFAAAQSAQDHIVAQLHDQGFSEITLTRTWLGRIRVIALRDDLRRELVFNPQSGEILRDYWVTMDEDEGEDNDDFAPQLFNPEDGSGNFVGDDCDDDYDDCDEDDYGDEDGYDDDDEDHDDEEEDDDDDDDDDEHDDD